MIFFQFEVFTILILQFGMAALKVLLQLEWLHAAIPQGLQADDTLWYLLSVFDKE